MNPALMTASVPRVLDVGPIATAPPASLENKDYYWIDNVTGIEYQSDGIAWNIVNNWLMYNGEFVLHNGEQINVDSLDAVIFGSEFNVVGTEKFLIGA